MAFTYNAKQDGINMSKRALNYSTPRHDWSMDEVMELFSLPFNDLLFQAHVTHRENFNPSEVQISTLLSIKTGGCAENCKYCSQSAHHETKLPASKLMEVNETLEQAKEARKNGASRFCMGAAWRNPKDRDMATITAMIKGVKELGMETCMTLGMLSDEQTDTLKNAGLDYYNHNIDTSRDYYDKVVTTRTFDDRLETLERVRSAGINVCSGGIVGMGEERKDRVSMLHTLATLPEHPQSVPVNMLVKVGGTPLDKLLPDDSNISPLEFVRTIAVARILMPKSDVRLSAGREEMSDELQAMCFFAGANSIFYGEKLLTTSNATQNHDMALFSELGIRPTEMNTPNAPKKCLDDFLDNSTEDDVSNHFTSDSTPDPSSEQTTHVA